MASAVRVTASAIRVTASAIRVTASTIRVTASTIRVTSFTIRVTSSTIRVTASTIRVKVSSDRVTVSTVETTTGLHAEPPSPSPPPLHIKPAPPPHHEAPLRCCVASVPGGYVTGLTRDPAKDAPGPAPHPSQSVVSQGDQAITRGLRHAPSAVHGNRMTRLVAGKT